MTGNRALAIDAAEYTLLRSFHDYAPEELKSALGLKWIEDRGVSISICAADKSIMLNRCGGLGIHESASTEQIHSIKNRYLEAGIERFFLQVQPAAQPENISELLVDCGMQNYRAWMKFVRAPDAPPKYQSTLEVRAARESEYAEFARIATTGFGLDEKSRPMLEAAAHHPDLHVFLGYAGDQPAACGVLFVHNGIGWLDFAATDPEFRRMGAQTALLCHRIAAAARLGCTTLATCTGEAAPGDPQHSYGNITKVGFQEYQRRENWIPDP